MTAIVAQFGFTLEQALDNWLFRIVYITISQIIKWSECLFCSCLYYELANTCTGDGQGDNMENVKGLSREHDNEFCTFIHLFPF